MDAFYTPVGLARKMVQCVTLKKVETVVDFAAGNGELLRAAQGRWPAAKFIAAEINELTVRELRLNYPTWQVFHSDFTSAGPENSPELFHDLINGAAVILLNPPFSCRGGTLYTEHVGEYTVRASYGLAFIIRALRHMSPSGELIALLPSGSLSTEKDAVSWQRLKCDFHVSTYSKNNENTFRDCSAETVIVRFRRRSSPIKVRKPRGHIPGRVIRVSAAVSVKLFRGKLSMNEALNGTPETVPLVHTTDLSDNFPLWKREVRSTYQTISGPAVLIPRVGKPSSSKIKILQFKGPVVLSDCIIALLCNSETDAVVVQHSIIQNWVHFRKLYNGTCAKFITLNSVQKFLLAVGIDSTSNSKYGLFV
jgi:tRNA1(Val) A37 N6-methylase TrmN6